MNEADREENADSSKYGIHWWVCLKVDIRIEILLEKNPNIHQPNTLPDGGGKPKQDIHGRLCKPIVLALGLAGRGDFLMKDGDDSFEGIARLKPRKERMRC